MLSGKWSLHSTHISDEVWNEKISIISNTTSKLLSICAIALGLIVILGWLFHIDILVRVASNLPAMMPNTALGIIALALASFAITQQHSKLAINLFASIAIFIGFTTLLEYIFQISTFVDHLLFTVEDPNNPFPGRSSPQTAISFILIGLGIIWLQDIKYKLWGQAAIGIAFAILYFILLGHIFNIDQIFAVPDISSKIGMALHTTIGLFLVSISLLMGQTDFGVMRLLSGKLHANRLARNFGGLILLSPLGIGAFLFFLNTYFEIDRGISVALFILLNSVVMMFALLRLAFSFESEEKSKSLMQQHVTSLLARYQNLLETAADAVIIVDHNAKIVQVNEQVESWLGYDRSSLIGQSVNVLVPDHLKEKHSHNINAYFKNPVKGLMNKGVDLWAKKRDGTLVPVEISLGTHIFDGEGYVTTFMRDMTERKIEQQRLEKRFTIIQLLHRITKIVNETNSVESVMRMCFEHINTFMNFDAAHLVEKDLHSKQYVDTNIWSTTKASLLTRLNLLGKQENLMIKKMLEHEKYLKKIEVYNLEDTDLAYSKRKMQVFRQLGIQSIILLPIHVNDNIEGYIEFFSTKDVQLTSDMKQVLDSIAIQMGRIYERRDKRLVLENALEIRQSTLAKVAHDLKNPLGNIMLSEQVLSLEMEKEKLNSNITKYLQIINRSSNYMLDLISDLLDFSKMEAGHYSVEISSISAKGLIEDSIQTVSSLAEEKKISIEKEIDDSVEDFIRADKKQLQRVLVNLLSNAIKFAPHDSKVVIKLRYEGDAAIISVRDQGPGISLENQEKIFNLYWQEDNVKRYGSGLGLAISKGIVEAHGGRLNVISEIGKGAEFYFYVNKSLQVGFSPSYDERPVS